MLRPKGWRRMAGLAGVHPEPSGWGIVSSVLGSIHGLLKYCNDQSVSPATGLAQWLHTCARPAPHAVAHSIRPLLRRTVTSRPGFQPRKSRSNLMRPS
ncbi:hypothetical protein BDM02DRAFT_1517926 [Thelephora ganbajun]|uniref:Uncharacterized protein n=1 Tax=Thelephora ganbajun TaxID=370292 RepID=A0ACB6ZKJ4_THEGA|nr:hypothetical protein BDM02DRAFT_1517926 [Thelephora ganbajun]